MRLGVDLGGTKIEAVVLDANGEVAWRKRVPTPQGNYDLILSTIVELVAEAKQANGMSESSPVGIGTPGALTFSVASKKVLKKAVMKNCNSTALNGKPLLDDLISALSCSVTMGNDANCFALAETLSGQGKQLSLEGALGGVPETVFGVILGTGVGGGIVVSGKVLHGMNAIAGEWGHNPLPALHSAPQYNPTEKPRLCYCGRENCIETFLSGPGLSLSFQRESGEIISAEQVIEKMREGHAEALSVWQQYKQQLAVSLAQVVNVLDPSLIVLGGGLSSIPELYEDISLLMVPYIFSDSFKTPVLPALLGDSAGVFGAAWLAY